MKEASWCSVKKRTRNEVKNTSDLISKSFPGYYHSLISSHTLKIVLYQASRTLKHMQGFFVILLDHAMDTALTRTLW